MNLGVSYYAVSILVALQAKHVYMGTVNYATKLQRRAKNKASRISRRRNR